jgi:organic hydroperoxide reductase OsmC/OhrA
MLIHRGEAWLDAGPARSFDVVDDNPGVVDALAVNVQFEERPEIRPEEVLATAHAASYCLTLWNRLKQSGHTPHRVHTIAYVGHDRAGAPRAEREIFLEANVEMTGMGDESLAAHAKFAKNDFVSLRGLAGVRVRVEPHMHC